MRAVYKTGPGTVEVLDVREPEAVPGAVVIATTVAALCGSDLHFTDDYADEVITRRFGVGNDDGIPLGHEVVGRVHSLGEGVRGLAIGDRVVAGSLTACGRCTACLSGAQNICRGGGGLLFGCQAEYVAIPFADIGVARIPDAVRDDQAVFASDILSVAIAAIERAGAAFGDTVAVVGQGPVGLCVTMAARARGAGLVIAVDTVPERLDMARRIGANVALDASTTDVAAEILDMTDGVGVDVAVEAVGSLRTFETCSEIVRQGGTLSSVGVYGRDPTLPLSTRSRSFLHRSVTTTLAPTGRHRLDQLLRLMEHGSMDPGPLISHRFTIEEAPKAYDLFRTRTEGTLKVVLEA